MDERIREVGKPWGMDANPYEPPRLIKAAINPDAYQAVWEEGLGPGDHFGHSGRVSLVPPVLRVHPFVSFCSHPPLLPFVYIPLCFHWHMMTAYIARKFSLLFLVCTLHCPVSCLILDNTLWSCQLVWPACEPFDNGLSGRKKEVF